MAVAEAHGPGPVLILFSGAAATFPGEWQEDHLPEWRFLPALAEWGNPATETDVYGRPKKVFKDWVIKAERLTLHDWLFSEDPDSISRRRFPFSNTLQRIAGIRTSTPTDTHRF